MSNISLPYLNSSVFVTEALTDSDQVLNHDGVPSAHFTDPPEQVKERGVQASRFIEQYHVTHRYSRRPTLRLGVQT